MVLPTYGLWYCHKHGRLQDLIWRFKIWSDVSAAPTKQEGLVTLIQYLMPGMIFFRQDFLGHADLLHVNTTLYNFVASDRFINPGDNPACLTVGFSMWTSLQGHVCVGAWMATADSDMLRSTLYPYMEHAHSNRKLEPRTWVYIGHSIFGAVSSLSPYCFHGQRDYWPHWC